MKIRWLLLLALSALVFNGASSASPNRVSLPRFVRLSLAGQRLHFGAGILLSYDVKSGYYLQYGADGAGRTQVMVLELCPDKNQLEYADADITIKRTSLPRLRTGSGVNIGDTPQQVRRKLGEPLNIYNYRNKNKTCVYLYSSWLPVKIVGGDSDLKWLYNARYTFHNGHLWAIRYTLDEPDTGDY